jgi:hypothetical protein
MGYRRNLLQEGRFGWGGRNGMSISEGYFWARRNGGYNAYFGRFGLAAVDGRHPVGVADAATNELVIKDVCTGWNDYWIIVKRVSGFGVESRGAVWRRIRTDGNGNGEEVPDEVIHLCAAFSGNGGVRLEWDYEPRLAAERPASFKIYLVDENKEGGSFIGSVVWREGQKHYRWDGSELGEEKIYRLIVRAESKAGIADQSERWISARGDGELPPTISRVDAETI